MDATLAPVHYTPIGLIHSPFTDVVGMPIQPVAAQGVAGRIELDPAYALGLKDVEGFSHLWLIYHLHRITEGSLTVVPFLDDTPRGIFATRSPKRPNPIGLSVVRLRRVEGLTLHIENVDVLDGTPLLDLKPYVPQFDVFAAERIGWFESKIHNVHATRADQRFR